MEESIVVATEEVLPAIFALQQEAFRLVVQNFSEDDTLPLWQTEEEITVLGKIQSLEWNQ